MPVSGATDRSALTLHPFLSTNAAQLTWQAQGNNAVSLPATSGYKMPEPALHLATAAVPELLAEYLNCTTVKGPFVDLQKECMESNGKVTVLS